MARLTLLPAMEESLPAVEGLESSLSKELSVEDIKDNSLKVEFMDVDTDTSVSGSGGRRSKHSLNFFLSVTSAIACFALAFDKALMSSIFNENLLVDLLATVLECVWIRGPAKPPVLVCLFNRINQPCCGMRCHSPQVN